jgi:hypothetical protein
VIQNVREAFTKRFAGRFARRAGAHRQGASPAVTAATRDLPTGYVAGSPIHLNDNGAWSWFSDERAIVHEGKLIVGSIRATGTFHDGGDPAWGNVEVAVLDPVTGAIERSVLHRHFEQDDHASPAFLALPDGRLLAVYTRHNVERRIYTRLSAPHDPLAWGPVSIVEPAAAGIQGRRRRGVTYSNLFRLPSGRILNFYRGLDRNPAFVSSDDSAQTWHAGGRLLRARARHSPYLKYAADGRGAIHFVATEDHPRHCDNGIFHGVLRDGDICLTDGTLVRRLGRNDDADLTVGDLTPVFRGDADHVAWVIALELDGAGYPRVVFSVQRDGRGLPRRQGGMDHRFYAGCWDGSAWRVCEVAYAGTRLYPGEDDYTGLAAFDRNDPDVIYISTDAEPTTGAPLVSRADGLRHHELFRGQREPAGDAWHWEPITANSTVDNLRPIVPKWQDAQTVLVWMRGSYQHYRGPWTTAVVATVLPSSAR